MISSTRSLSLLSLLLLSTATTVTVTVNSASVSVSSTDLSTLNSKLDTIKDTISQLNDKQSIASLSATFHSHEQQLTQQLTHLIDAVTHVPTVSEVSEVLKKESKQNRDVLVEVVAASVQKSADSTVKAMSAAIDSHLSSLDKSLNEVKSQVSQLLRQQATLNELKKEEHELKLGIQSLQKQQQQLLRYFNRSESTFAFASLFDLPNIRSYWDEATSALHSYSVNVLRRVFGIESWPEARQRLMVLIHRIPPVFHQTTQQLQLEANQRYTVWNTLAVKRLTQLGVPKPMSQYIVWGIISLMASAVLLTALKVLTWLIVNIMCCGMCSRKTTVKRAKKKHIASTSATTSSKKTQQANKTIE